MHDEFQRGYLLRLPLPLAQLYSRAHNSKDARGRHDNTFYLLEALVKLTAAPSVVAYLEEEEAGAARNPALDRLLAQLALPSLGQWVGLARELARHFGTRADAASHPLGHVWDQLNRPRRDLPAILALYRRIKNGPDGQPAADQSCSVLQIFEALVQYRNAVFGHGAGRWSAFYEEDMGPLLFPAANELLAEGILDHLGPRGSRLVYLTEVRTVAGSRVEVSLRDLVGLQGERMSPLQLEPDKAVGLVPNRVAVLWPGQSRPLSLHPLLLYRESEVAADVLFLNRDRNGRQVEYLSYMTGRTERDRETATALAALLSRVTGREVGEAELQALGEQSFSQAPSVESLFAPETPGTQRLGDYEVVAEVGRGGMGVVYLARQLSLGRMVALKMLPADLSGDAGALARFRREIEVLARCEHPNIVKVLSSGTLPDGRLYYTMEYVPGCNLEQVWRELGGEAAGPASRLGGSTWAKALHEASRKQRAQVRREPPAAPPSEGPAGPVAAVVAPPLPPLPEPPPLPDTPGEYVRRVVALVRDAALALQAVHEQGIVHRDVKPANIMLTPDGSRAVLMDFGLAKGQSLALTSSRQGGFLGTLRYAGPEQLASGTLKVGPAADIRGLGVTLWELLTRRRLFAEAADEAQLALSIHERDVPLLRKVDPGLDRDLEAIVARATERRASERTASARELVSLLQLYLDGRSLPIRPPGTAELAWRWVRSHKGLVASAAAVAAALLVVLVSLLVLYKKDQDEKVYRAHEEAVDAREQIFRMKLDRMKLDKPDLSPQALSEMDDWLAQYERLDRGKGVDARRRWRDQFSEAIDKELGAERFGPEDEARARAGIDWWVGRDDKLVKDLNGKLDVRRQAWSSVLHVESPFADINTAFDAGTVSAAGDALVSRRGSQALRPALVPTRAQCQGNLQLEAVFQAPSWGQVSQLGLGLYDNQAHTDEVSWVAFRPPDGDLIASASRDGTIKLWSPTDGRIKTTLQAPTVATRLAAFSPDGKLLASTGTAGKVYLWDVAGGGVRAVLDLGQSWVHDLAFSPDGKYLLTAASGDAQLWDVAAGKSLGYLANHSIMLVPPVFSPDGKLLADPSQNKTVRLIDYTAKKERAVLPGTDQEVSALTFDREGGRLFVADAAGLVKCWDVAAAKPLYSFQVGVKLPKRIALSADGTLLVAVSESSEPGQLWQLPPANKSARLLKVIEEASELRFGPQGHTLALAHWDGAPRFWDAAAGAWGSPLEGASGYLHCLAFSPDGKSLVAGGDSIGLWDAVTKRPRASVRRQNYTLLLKVPVPDPPGQQLLAHGRTLEVHNAQEVVFSRDGRRLACSGYDGVTVWSTTSARPPVVVRGGKWGGGACLSDDGKSLASWDTQGTDLLLWDAETGRAAGTLPGHDGGVRAAAFAPDGKSLFSLDRKGAVRIWALPEARPRVVELEDNVKPGSTWYAAFAPGGRALAVADARGTIALWNLPEGKKRGVCPTAIAWPRRIAFHPDGDLLAVAGRGGAASLWDLAAGKERAAVGREQSVNDAAFSPDGRSLATAGGDGTLRFWDVADAAWQGTQDLHGDWLGGVAYSPDGHFLATLGGGRGNLRLWDLGRGTLGAVVRAGGQLSVELTRDGTPLHRSLVRLPPEAAGQPLRLTAYLEDDRLTFQVNDLPPAKFEDSLPLRGARTGVFSLYWPDGVRLERLRAGHKPPPAGSGSLLEQGDDCHARGELARALAYYQDQVPRASNPRAAREARCKAALCLQALKRQDQAAELFQQVAAEEGTRWPALAACQLWLIRLRQDRRKDANAVLVDLTSRYRPEDLLAIIPQTTREEILKAYSNFRYEREDFTFARRSEDDVRRALAVEELFDAADYVKLDTELFLVRVLHENGEVRPALALAETLERRSIGPWSRLDVLEEYVWLLIRTGAADQAREELARWVFPAGGYPDSEYDYEMIFVRLLWLRAAVNAALKHWDDAEQDLKQYRERFPLTDREQSADVMWGFLLERRGRAAEAKAAWGEAYRKRFAAGQFLSPYTIMLGSLSDRVTEADVQKILDASVDDLSIPGVRALKNRVLRAGEMLPVYRELWRSRRGREYARQIAFKEISAADLNSVPAILYVYEALHQGALPGELSTEHDEFLWKLASDTCTGYASGKLSDAQIVQMVLLWGDPGAGFTWTVLSAQLKPDLRGPIAYALGQRCLRRGKAADAALMFKAALADAPADSPLARLAEAAMKGPEKKSPR